MPERKKIQFKGASGDTLAGLLELPDLAPRAYILFAHCFTCGKDIAAASRISRQLVKHDFAVLRFDFTGLGGSDGDFANTNFSSNVEDLVAAADYLRREYQAPRLLIGHSLGGTAVLRATQSIPESAGVVTIGSPADASHVSHLFSSSMQTIADHGEAQVNLAGRQFTITRQFLDDISNSTTQELRELEDALLIMHSPVDSIVPIQEAERIYQAAKHPKSFVSLADADHLLSKSQDAAFAADVIAAWAQQLIPESIRQTKTSIEAGELSVSEIDHRFKLDIHSDDHHWLADEPSNVGGSNQGPDPYELLLASVGACTAMTVRMYADRKQWPLDDVSIVLRHRRDHISDCENCESGPRQIDTIDREISFAGKLSDQQRSRLLEIADKCPVHRTLTGHLQIETVHTDANTKEA